MSITPVSTPTTQSGTGLDFQSLLQIILQQLTYQDPLKPMDNFQFVSQLAQFSQLQQTQTLNTSISNLLTAQASLQATGLLGRKVDFITDSSTTISGATVTAVAYSGGQPTLTLKGADAAHTIYKDVTLSSVVQILAQ